MSKGLVRLRAARGLDENPKTQRGIGNSARNTAGSPVSDPMIDPGPLRSSPTWGDLAPDLVGLPHPALLAFGPISPATQPLAGRRDPCPFPRPGTNRTTHLRSSGKDLADPPHGPGLSADGAPGDVRRLTPAEMCWSTRTRTLLVDYFQCAIFRVKGAPF